HVADAGRDQLVRAHDREIDVRGEHVPLESRDVVRLEIHDAGEEREAGVSGHHVDGRHAVAVDKTPRDRVLAPTAAEHETVETRRSRRPPESRLAPVLRNLAMAGPS